MGKLVDDEGSQSPSDRGIVLILACVVFALQTGLTDSVFDIQFALLVRASVVGSLNEVLFSLSSGMRKRQYLIVPCCATLFDVVDECRILLWWSSVDLVVCRPVLHLARE